MVAGHLESNAPAHWFCEVFTFHFHSAFCELFTTRPSAHFFSVFHLLLSFQINLTILRRFYLQSATHLT